MFSSTRSTPGSSASLPTTPSVRCAKQIFKNGECIYQSPSITEIRDYCMREVDTLWDQIKRFENPQTYFVDLSKKLWTCKNELLESCRI